MREEPLFKSSQLGYAKEREQCESMRALRCHGETLCCSNPEVGQERIVGNWGSNEAAPMIDYEIGDGEVRKMMRTSLNDWTTTWKQFKAGLLMVARKICLSRVISLCCICECHLAFESFSGDKKFTTTTLWMT